MNERDRRDDPADNGWVEVERSVHAVDPDSELGRAMAKAREAGIMEPGDFNEDSIRPTPVPQEPK